MASSPIPNSIAHPYAFGRGRDAGLMDKPMNNNPFALSARKMWDAWADGWRQGQIDRQKAGRS